MLEPCSQRMTSNTWWGGNSCCGPECGRDESLQDATVIIQQTDGGQGPPPGRVTPGGGGRCPGSTTSPKRRKLSGLYGITEESDVTVER